MAQKNGWSFRGDPDVWNEWVTYKRFDPDLLRRYTKLAWYKYNLSFLGVDQGYGSHRDVWIMHMWSDLAANARFSCQGLLQCTPNSEVCSVLRTTRRNCWLCPTCRLSDVWCMQIQWLTTGDSHNMKRICSNLLVAVSSLWDE